MSTGILPLADRVVVKKVEDDGMRGGLYIPDSAKDKQLKGHVVAVGAGRLLNHGERWPMQVRVGHIVLYAAYTGNEVMVEGEEFIILSEADLLAVIGYEEIE